MLVNRAVRKASSWPQIIRRFSLHIVVQQTPKLHKGQQPAFSSNSSHSNNTHSNNERDGERPTFTLLHPQASKGVALLRAVWS